MYKPNGEEPMTRQEEMRRKEAAAEHMAARERVEPAAESLRVAFYSALFRSTSAQEGKVGALVGDAQ
jgi:hypothetical protein